MPAHPTPRPVFFCECGNHAWAVATRGFVVLVSECDDHLLATRAWNAAKRSNTYYAQAAIKRKLHYLHRIVLTAPEIDHKNRWGMDNRRENLRPCTRAQNMANAKGTGKTSKFKGVSWSKQANKWIVFFGTGSSRKYLGIFDDEMTAAAAYDCEAFKTHGEFARLNLGGAHG